MPFFVGRVLPASLGTYGRHSSTGTFLPCDSGLPFPLLFVARGSRPRGTRRHYKVKTFPSTVNPYVVGRKFAVTALNKNVNVK